MSQSWTPFTGRSTAFVASLPSNIHASDMVSGDGSPEGTVPGVPGQTYRDLLSDNLWMKISGTQKLGWVLIGIFQCCPAASEDNDNGDMNSGTFVTGEETDPNGSVTATGPAMYVSETDHSLWFKPTGITGNSGWLRLLG